MSLKWNDESDEPHNHSGGTVNKTSPKIVMLPLSKLKEDPKNPRTISPTQLRALGNSMKRWGIIEPIIVNKDHTIIGGHQRYKALKEAGEKMAPCVVVDLEPTEAKALNLALNRISGDWDESSLLVALRELEDIGIDISITGFTEADITRLEIIPDIDIDEAALREIKMICPKCGFQW